MSRGRSRNRRKRINNESDKVFLKCEVCGSNNLRVLAISPKSEERYETGGCKEVRLGWTAMCQDCHSIVSIAERWATQSQVFYILMQDRKRQEAEELNNRKETSVSTDGR